MPNPLENQMLMYYLAGMGGALSEQGGNKAGVAMGQMTQQQIQSQNYMKMLKGMLGGMPAGAKLSGDKDNLTVKMPTNTLDLAQEGSAAPGGSGTNWADPKNFNQLSPQIRGSVNPSASPLDVSGADLAGLTPKEISSALQFKFAQDELGTKSIGNLVDIIYKGKLMEKADADIANERPVFTIPGTNISLNSKQYLDWKKMSEEKKTSTSGELSWRRQVRLV